MLQQSLLIEQLQQGNAKAFEKLYDQYSGALYGVIVRICSDKSLAEEILQDTFLKIWEQASLYDPDKGRFYTWAYRIARNTSLNRIRSRDKLIQTNDLSVYKVEDEATEEQNLLLPDLNEVMKQLDPHHREALELVYFRGLTHREAHQIMDVPLGTFKSYVQQALKKLRELNPALWLGLVSLIEWIA